MPKIKIDTTGVDAEKAKAQGNFEPARPGVYRFKITEVNAGFSRTEGGDPDRKRPRLEVVFSCLDAKYPGSQVWLYLPLKGSEKFDEVAKSKMAQLLLAVEYPKAIGASEMDTDKHLLNKVVKVRVRAGSNQHGDYKAEFGSVFPDDGESDDEVGVGDDELMGDDDEALIEEESLDDGGEVDGYDAEMRTEELTALGVPDLKVIARELGIVLAGKTKTTLVEAIVEAEAAAASEGGDDELIEDEELIEDGSEYLTAEQLTAMDNADLKTTAAQFDVAIVKGMKKSELVAAILEAQGAGSGDDEMPF